MPSMNFNEAIKEAIKALPYATQMINSTYAMKSAAGRYTEAGAEEKERLQQEYDRNYRLYVAAIAGLEQFGESIRLKNDRRKSAAIAMQALFCFCDGMSYAEQLAERDGGQ